MVTFGVFLYLLMPRPIWRNPVLEYLEQDLTYRMFSMNRLLDSVGEGEGGTFRENSTETSIPSSVKQIASPGWMHETSAQGWCTGKTQRDGMGRRWEGVQDGEHM